MREGYHFIGGENVGGSGSLASLNPANGEPVGQFPRGTSSEVSQAVEAASVAQKEWCRATVAERAAIIRKAADAIAAEYGAEGEPTELKLLIREEMGKPLPEADIEVIESSDMLGFFSSEALAALSEMRLQLDQELWPSKRSVVTFEPVGVVGVIKPWNYPFELPLWSIGAALVAGNAVVLKPSENTPFVGLEIARIFERAGLPPGVLNIVTGDGETGRLVVESDVNMVSFTGSVSVGREIAEKCGRALKKCSLELGGKDTCIVLADADLELAANGVVWGAFTNCGQVCTSIERVIVDQAVAEELTQKIVERARSLVLGRDVGPLVSAGQLDKIAGQVEDARSKGASVLTGGSRPEDPALRSGFYYLPTVLSHVDRTMAVLSEETFGPVVTIQAFEDDDSAIEMANDSIYGLGATVWSVDLDRSRHVAGRLQAGMVWVNDVNVAFPQAPWIGRKSSGLGVELSVFGIREFCNLKHLNWETGSDNRRDWWYPYA